MNQFVIFGTINVNLERVAILNLSKFVFEKDDVFIIIFSEFVQNITLYLKKNIWGIFQVRIVDDKLVRSIPHKILLVIICLHHPDQWYHIKIQFLRL